MALVANILDLSKTTDICLLWGEMSVLFQLATHYDFVAHTLAATSAQRLAVTTKSHEASEDAYQYRKQALHGLYRAMGSFSKDNADAILAASLGCSYIMSDHRSLMTLAGNISTVSLDDIILSSTPLTVEQVATRMKPWLKRSAFHRIFTYEPSYYETEEQAAATPPKTGDVEHRFAVIRKLLAEGVNSVNGLAFCFQSDRDLSAVLRQLRDVMRLVHERLGSEISTEDQYRLIYPFTAWFVKSSAASYVSLSKKNPFLLVFLLHMYAVVVTLTAALPRIDVPLFAKFRLRAILEICHILKDEPGFLCQRCNGVHAYNEVMAFPLNSVSVYQQVGRERAFPVA
ncbi:helicase [Trichoderma arundinaceum]|uniref:Helicase n=1 Tax=Trichoderma arundinaceum TaxID=490622 RepID=A0A395NFF1_TRIAR|nr:helicase [Trichoderma arundinaceum]